MQRIFGMVCLLFGLLLPAMSQAAADIGMPSEANVATAVSEEIAGWKVCSLYLPFNFSGESQTAVLEDKAWRESDPIKKAIGAFVREKLAISGTQADRNGNPTPTLQLTATGKKALNTSQGRVSLCFAKRKLVDVVMYTPPAAQDTYVVVNVVYRWTPDEVETWAAPLAEAQALGGVSEAELTATNRATIVLVFTNHGWKAQSGFKKPIGN